jgi:hypothetical protein
MEQKKFEKILNILYPNLKVTNYKLFERFEVNSNGEFTENISPAIFVEVKGKTENYGISIGDDMSRMIGFEVVVDKFD